MPMPTTSPEDTVAGFQGSRVSSVIIGSPYFSGVAAARTYNHRGVITPTPNDKALGLMRWTFIQSPVSERYAHFQASTILSRRGYIHQRRIVTARRVVHVRERVRGPLRAPRQRRVSGTNTRRR